MSGVHSKRYRSLLSGLIFSRVALIVLVLRLFLARNDFDLASFAGHISGALLIVGVFAFFEYDSLPSRFWFESEVLCVEDTSGRIDRFERWVITKAFGFETLHAQSAQRTLRVPVCGYVKSSQSLEVITTSTEQPTHHV
jgi:hypothetical protein